MTLLVLGLVLWSLAHLFKRLAPGLRGRLGDPGKGLVALVSVAGIVLMVIGYRGWDSPQLWYPMAALTHVNNLLMLLALYLFAADGMKTRAWAMVRHPQLTAVKIWAVAHLLVNGDLASVILFGGLLAWAVVSVILINRSEPAPNKVAAGSVGKEIGAVIGAILVTGAIGGLHALFNLTAFGG